MAFVDDPSNVALRDDTKDAGGIAAEILKERKAEMRRKRAKRIVQWAMFLAVVICGLGAFAQNAWNNRTFGRVADTRECKASINDGAVEITGSRVYSYPYIEIMGYRFSQMDQMDEKTTIDLTGNAMTLIGYYTFEGKDKWWAHATALGERGVLILKKADLYTFVIGKNVGVVKYKGLCN